MHLFIKLFLKATDKKQKKQMLHVLFDLIAATGTQSNDRVPGTGLCVTVAYRTTQYIHHKLLHTYDSFSKKYNSLF
jgi:hypothetical protein